MQIRLLWQIFFQRRLPLSNIFEITSADLVLGQAFGLPANVCSNIQMANLVDSWYRLGVKLPLLLQWEIADSVKAAQVTLRIEKHRMPGRRLDTHEVTAQAASYWFGTLGKNRKTENRAVILAHPDHVWRCAKTAEKLGFRPVIISMDSVEYPSNSEQRWTRSAWRFRPYDILARLLYWNKGWI